MLELAYQVLENLAERAEAAADFAIDSDNRDVESEPLVSIREVGGFIQYRSCPKSFEARALGHV